MCYFCNELANECKTDGKKKLTISNIDIKFETKFKKIYRIQMKAAKEKLKGIGEQKSDNKMVNLNLTI